MNSKDKKLCTPNKLLLLTYIFRIAERYSSYLSRTTSKSAPNFMVKLLANFNSEMKGMLPYVGKVYEGDVSKTKNTFNWTTIQFDKMALDTAESVTTVLKN